MTGATASRTMSPQERTSRGSRRSTMPSDRPDRRRVVVVGGGIVGSAVALGLADLGMPVTLIDQTGPGSGGLVAGAATAASCGSISAFGRHQAGDYELACT